MNSSLDIILKTEAGSLIFAPVNVREGEEKFDFNITCVLVGRFSGLLSGNFVCRLFRGDIERLLIYFYDHVQVLMAGGGEAPSFVPLEGDIQIKALDGEVVDMLDGYFTINILFNCGKPDEASSNVYFGFEAVVELSELNKFCDGLRRLVFS